MMDPILNTMLTILVMVLLGYLVKRIKILEFSDVDKINKLVIYITMPAMIFMVLYSSDMSLLPKLSIMPLVGVGIGAVTGLITFTVLTIKKFPKVKKWSIVITTALGNTAFLGFPVILGIFGNEGLIRAIFYDIASLLTFLSLSIILMINFGGTLKEVIKKVLSFPILWAVILGVSLNYLNITIGEVASNVLNYLGAAAIPLIMISLGVSLDFESLKDNFKISTMASFFKLIVSPIIGVFIAILVGLSGTEYTIAIVESAMASGMLNLTLAITYKLDVKLTSDCIFLSLLFSFITLPIVISLI